MGQERFTRAWRKIVGSLGGGESALVLGAATASALTVTAATSNRRGYSRSSLMGLLAFDLSGGLVAFQLPPTREKYAASSRRDRLVFALVHLQPFAVPILGEGSWSRAAARYGSAVTATVLMDRWQVTAARRRMVANAAAAALSVTDRATNAGPQKWFGPVYLMKVIGGHGGLSHRN